MTGAQWVPLRTAWEAALYGPGGFYRRESPVDHFRTSAHVSPLFAAALVELVRRSGHTSLWDLGAGDGGLLGEVHACAPGLRLVGVDLRDRPVELPAAVGWQRVPPVGSDGLVFANELLDNLPCDVVERDTSGDYRLLEVDQATGDERLGDLATAAQRTWVDSWWPLHEVGDRAEVGLSRESWWADVVATNPRAACVTVDYGHQALDRPPGGSLTSYRHGVQTPVSYGGGHDITAGVAFDALAAAVGGELRTQRAVLLDLGVSGARPPLDLATSDPAGYLRDLSRATEAAELTAVGGLGDLTWLLTSAREP